MPVGSTHPMDWPKVLYNSLPSRLLCPWPADWLESAAFQWKLQDTRDTQVTGNHSVVVLILPFHDNFETWVAVLFVYIAMYWCYYHYYYCYSLEVVGLSYNDIWCYYAFNTQHTSPLVNVISNISELSFSLQFLLNLLFVFISTACHSTTLFLSCILSFSTITIK